MTERPLVADAMLGRLARWLRALGRDVIYDETLDDRDLLRTARTEGRILLTRDRRLQQDSRRSDWCRLVEAERPRAQLLELDPTLQLFTPGWRGRLFSRCLVCNTRLEDAEARAVERSLPSEVRGDPRVRSAGFRRCPTCERVFWDGSHTRRMRRWLEGLAVEASIA